MQRCPRSVKRVGITWGISGDVCIYYIYCVFCRYANHVVVSRFVRIDYGFECVLPPTMRTPSILAKVSFVRMYRTDMSCHGIAFASCIQNEFEKFEFGKITVLRKAILLNPSENLSSLRGL